MCRSRKIWIVLAVVAVAVAIAAPNPGAALPLLLVAACPLMMLVMMIGGMAGLGRDKHNEEATSTHADADEVARLRAEVAELRERADH
jgi:hypothetical protein